ncbi:MAG TPA: amphi-Trp domain-containing protein [Solirubrobacterales bacterium]|jgi:amphi-Trp domain-containing protein|nr:amphi-Trp domain-containing protein [Solirubrobacterales bacterium]
MDTFEVEQRETLTREEAATRLRRIANLLSGAGEEVKFDRGEMKFKVAIPERVDWKVGFETGGSENELEIELKW